MKCVFCNRDLKQGTGLVLIKNDGKIIPYCSKKCINNLKLKRSPRSVTWLLKQKKTKVEKKKEEKKA